MHTLALVTALTLAAAEPKEPPRITVGASDYGPHQAEIDKFMATFRPEVARMREKLPTSETAYTIQVYALDKDKGVYVVVIRRSEGTSREGHFEIPIDKATPKEAAQDMAKNVRMAVECDLAGKGLVENCQGGTDDDRE